MSKAGYGSLLETLESYKKHIKELEKRISHVEEARKIQGTKGNWDMDEYMRGMYNSLEFAMACLEDRDPIYKDQQESEGGGDVCEWKKESDGPSLIYKTSCSHSYGIWYWKNLEKCPACGKPIHISEGDADTNPR